MGVNPSGMSGRVPAIIWLKGTDMGVFP